VYVRFCSQLISADPIITQWSASSFKSFAVCPSLLFLPGAGVYRQAKASKTARIEWHAMTKSFFLERRTLGMCMQRTQCTL